MSTLQWIEFAMVAAMFGAFGWMVWKITHHGE